MLGQVFFWQAWPVLRAGAARQLQVEDLLPLDADLEPTLCDARLWQAWSRVRTCKQPALTYIDGRA